MTRILLLALLLLARVASAQTATPTLTPTLTPTVTPTFATPDVRRANLVWYVRWEDNYSQPNRGIGGLAMASDGRLQDMQVICSAVQTGTFTVTKNGANTVLSCSYTSNLGCNDLYRLTGDSVNYSQGDLINLSGGPGFADHCHVQMAVLGQDGSAHNATVVWGRGSGATNNDFCYPEFENAGGDICLSTQVNDAWPMPRAATVTNYALRAEKCTGFVG
jgi:hypothetical protein